MPIVHECAADGCKVLTMGEFCIDHEEEADSVDEWTTAEAAAKPREQAEVPASSD